MGPSTLAQFFTCSIVVVSVLARIAPWETKGPPGDPFARSIAQIVAKNDGTEATLANLEPQLLALLQDHHSPEEKGIIYASIADMYAQKGDTPPDDGRTRKAIEYSRLALKEPLDALNVCRMCSVWGGRACSFRLPPERFAPARRKAALIALLGLRSALEHGAPAQRQPGLSVFRYDYTGPPNSPEMEALRQEHRRAMEAHERVEQANELADYRQEFIRRCVDLYAQPPYDAEELKAISEVILLGYDDVASEMAGKVAARTEQTAPVKPKPQGGEAGPKAEAPQPGTDLPKEPGQ